MDLYIHIKYNFLKSKIVSSDAKIIYSLIDNFYQEQIDCEKIAKQKFLLGIIIVLLIVCLSLNVVIC